MFKLLNFMFYKILINGFQIKSALQVSVAVKVQKELTIMKYIQWCNENNGFLTAILSITSLLLSVTAIVVSIMTARLPYKKKILLASSLTLGMTFQTKESVSVMGMAASATNVGNRPIGIRYLGYAIKKDGTYHCIYPISREFNCNALLEPSKEIETQFSKEELIKAFLQEAPNSKLYIFARDTQGSMYKRSAGTVKKLLQNLGS